MAVNVTEYSPYSPFSGVIYTLNAPLSPEFSVIEVLSILPQCAAAPDRTRSYVSVHLPSLFKVSIKSPVVPEQTALSSFNEDKLKPLHSGTSTLKFRFSVLPEEDVVNLKLWFPVWAYIEGVMYKYTFPRSFGANISPEGAIAVHELASPDKPKLYDL